MAQPKMDSGGLTLMDAASSGLKIDEALKPKEVKIDTKPLDMDLGTQLADLENKTGQAEKAQSAGLDVIDFDLGGGLADITQLSSLGSLDKHLQQAKVLLKDKKYSEALAELELALDEDPNHQEAIFLKAMCLLKTEGPMEALRVLAVLVVARTTGKLMVQVEKLLGRIRLPLHLEGLLLLKTGRETKAVELLRELASLDPGHALNYQLLSTCLCMQNNLGEAVQVLETGAGLVPAPEAESLCNMAANLRPRLLRQVLEPVAGHIRATRYKKALSELKRVPREYAGFEECKILEQFLRKKAGGFLSFMKSKKSKPIRLKGSFKAIDNIYAILVKPEIEGGIAAMNQADFAVAEVRFHDALAVTPDYPYANYLTAACIYKGTFFEMITGAAEGPIRIRDNLKRARDLAKIGMKDEEISGAKDLLQALEDLLDHIAKLEAEMAAKQKEIDAVNQVMQEFVDIMKDAEAGIGSLEAFKDISGRMGKLPGLIRQVLGMATLEESRRHLHRLEQVVAKNLETLESMKPRVAEAERDLTVFKELQDRYISIMNGVKGGVGSMEQADRCAHDLESLSRDCQSKANLVSGSDAVEAIKRLKETVDNNLKQIKDVRKSISESAGDQKVVEKYVNTFKSLMDHLNSGTAIKSMDDLLNAIKGVERLANMTRDAAKNEVHSVPAKSALNNLADNMDQVAGQLRSQAHR